MEGTLGVNTSLCSHLLANGVETQFVYGIELDRAPAWVCLECAHSFVVEMLKAPGIGHRITAKSLTFTNCGHVDKEGRADCALCYDAIVASLTVTAAHLKLSANKGKRPDKILYDDIRDVIRKWFDEFGAAHIGRARMGRNEQASQ